MINTIVPTVLRAGQELPYMDYNLGKKLAFALFKKTIQHFALFPKLIREMPFF